VLVGVSGAVNLTAQVSVRELYGTGAYAWLVLAKVGGLVALGACGAAHRRWALRRLEAARPGAFWLIAAGELVLMAALIGTAAVLGQTAR
jgi:putative copper export protein